MKYNITRISGWVVLWVLLLWISRANHPTLMLNFAATTLMIFAAIAARAVIMQSAITAPLIVRWGAVALGIVGAGILAALAIHSVYDVAVGPDPRRFGLVANIGMDTAVVAVLVALIGGLDWSVRRFAPGNLN